MTDIQKLTRVIKVVNGKINVKTENIKGYLYAYYLIFGSTIEKFFYSTSNKHTFEMPIESGHYKCVFFYKKDTFIETVIENLFIENNTKCISTSDFIDEQVLLSRDFSRWGMDLYEYKFLHEFFEKKSFERGIHSVIYNKLPIDIRIDLKGAGPLFIFFNGALLRSDNMKLPIFSGLGIIPENASIICISDPSLYLNNDLRLSWYAGSAFQNLQPILLKIIKFIIKKTNCSRSVFVGGSGGGFASLYYSREIDNSVAIIWNPQTDILKYVPKFVSEYGKYAFGLKNDTSYMELALQVDTNLLIEYSKGCKNKIFYMQNNSDWHLQKHCLPFVRFMTNNKALELDHSFIVNENFYVQLVDWGNGHAPPPKETIKTVLSTINNFTDIDGDNLLERVKDCFYEK